MMKGKKDTQPNGTAAVCRTIKQAGIICGIAGPVVYTLAVVAAGFFQPGYNHATQLMSELGAAGAPHAGVMNLAGFAATGILLIIFAAGFYCGFEKVRGASSATALLAVTGFLYIGEAYFRCDTGCIPVTASGFIHLQLGELSVFVFVLAAFVIADVLKSAGNWKGYWEYSAGTGLLVMILTPLLLAWPDMAGLFQRLLAGVILAWWEVMAIRMYLLNTRRIPGSSS
jgi:hypothetical membrane protein